MYGQKMKKATVRGGNFVTSMNETQVGAGNTAKGFTMSNPSHHTMGVGHGSSSAGNAATPGKSKRKPKYKAY